MLNIKEFIDGVHEYLEKQFSPVLKRLKALEDRAPVPGEPGEKGAAGIDGKDGAPGEPGEKGAAGIDGKDGAPGEPGEKGAAGIDGKDGAPGEPGEKGAAGIDGKDGAPGEPGEKGAAGIDGKDCTPEDIKSVMDNQIAIYALEFERRATDALQKAIAALPTPKNGIDGIGFDDLEVVQLSEKQIQIIFKKGDHVKEFTIDMPIVVDCGVYGSGKSYRKGDGVTYAGSFWISQVNKPSQGPGKGAEWRLAVKKGKDANV